MNFQTLMLPTSADVYACNCIGPRNGDPVCPCQMRDYNQRKIAEEKAAAFDELMRKKPRVRVKAISSPKAAP